MIFFDQNDTFAICYPLNICLDFAERCKNEKLLPGRYDLEDGVYCSVLDFELKKNDNFFFEAHRKYADLHYILEGTQKMWVGLLDNMEIVDYTEEKDFVEVKGQHQVEILQTTGTGTVVFPNDVHALDPGYVSEKNVKKIIFKIPLELFEEGI